jgi:hypothetical protein
MLTVSTILMPPQTNEPCHESAGSNYRVGSKVS